MNLRRTLAVGIAAAALAGAVAYQMGAFSGRDLGPSTEVSPEPAAPEPARVATVRSRVVERSFSAVGSVTTRETIDLAARIRARVAEVLVRAGDSVARGEPLVRLTARATEARVGQAVQTLAAAKAERARVEKEHDRVVALFEREAATQRALERAQAERDRARAEVARARAALSEARAIEARTIIRAPKAGEIRDRFVDPGDLAVPGRSLLELQTPGDLRLSVFVREGLATRVDVGDSLRFSIPAAEIDATGPVVEIVPSVDPASRAFELKVGLPSGRSIVPGMFGRAFVPAGKSRAVLVPPEAIHRVGQLELVRARDPSGRWVLRHVTTGAAIDDALEVLSGLEGGEKVALRGPSEGERS